MTFELTVDTKIPDTPLWLGHGPKIADEELRAAMNASVLQVKGAILPLVPVNQGMLRQGVQTSITGDAFDLRGRIFDPITYALPVEEGTKPHFPPLAPLMRWAQLKLGVSEKDSRSVAFLVARAISRRGTKAVRFFAQAWQATQGQVVDRFERARARIIERLGGQ